jgi:thiol-disulfide isomerase/thioredoxin
MNRISPRQRRMAGVVAVFGALQMLAVVAYRGVQDRREAERGGEIDAEPLSGDPAPELELVTARGDPVRWAALRGKPVLVHFWASWCTPCRQELPALLEAVRARNGELQLLAVSVDEDWAPVRLFFGGHVPDEVSRTGDRNARRRFGVETLPTTFVVSSTGKLVARVTGARNWKLEQVREALQTWERSTP